MDHQPLSWQDWYKIALALTIWREASGEGRTGMRAVGHVIRNRVNAKWGDWDHVITAKWQFSSLTAPGDPMLVKWPDSPDPSFETAMSLADQIYDGSDPDITDGAVLYCNPKHIDKDGWFDREVLQKPAEHPRVAVIGQHEFFR